MIVVCRLIWEPKSTNWAKTYWKDIYSTSKPTLEYQTTQLLYEGWMTKTWYKVKLLNSSPGDVFSSGVQSVHHKTLFLSHKKFFRHLWLRLKTNYAVITFEPSNDVTWTSPVNAEKTSINSGSPLASFQGQQRHWIEVFLDVFLLDGQMWLETSSRGKKNNIKNKDCGLPKIWLM